MSGPRRPNRKWLWASLGLLAAICIGVVAGSLWLQRAPRAIAEEVEIEPAAPPPIEVPDAQVADIGTDAPVAEPVVIDEVVEEEPVVEEPPVVKPKAKKKRRKKPAAATEPATPAATEAEPANETDAAPEPDEGIDWTVPDFPEEEPPPPTGTPDAPARNPVVIDQPPAQ